MSPLLLALLLLPVCCLSVHADPPPDDTTRVVPFDVQGHRGARGLLPENTIPAFLRALELGVTTLEMDTAVAGDSTVVVSHEPWMAFPICSLPSGEPVPGDEQQQHRLIDMTYAEIARYDCGRRGHPDFPEQQPMAVHKPRLRDVIAAAEGYAATHGLPPPRYNIETKSRPEWDDTFTPDPATFTRLLYDVLVETGVKDRAMLQSFDVRTLQVARDLDPDWSLVLLIARDYDQGLAANLDGLGFVPDVYSPDYRLVDAALVEAVHARGMRLIPWTVNALEEMQRLKALGVDGIITDYPDRGVTLLE
jgi:glycerophosphoryl diester phosphodiesterase